MKSTNVMKVESGPTLLSEVHAHHGRTSRKHWRLWVELAAFGVALAVVGLVLLGGPAQPPPIDLSRAPAAAPQVPPAAVTEPAPAAPAEPASVEASAEASAEATGRPVHQGEPVIIPVSRPIRE